MMHLTNIELKKLIQKKRWKKFVPSWTKAKPVIQYPVRIKKQSRRITAHLEFLTRQRNLTKKENSKLKGLLFAQRIHAQLTEKQWKLFKSLGIKNYDQEGNTIKF